MAFKDILKITIEEATQIYEKMNISFICKDGKLKGFNKEFKYELHR